MSQLRTLCTTAVKCPCPSVTLQSQSHGKCWSRRPQSCWVVLPDSSAKDFWDGCLQPLARANPSAKGRSLTRRRVCFAMALGSDQEKACRIVGGSSRISMDHVGKLKASNSDLTTIDYDMERALSGVGGAELHVRGMQRMLARTSHEHFGVEEKELEERREVCKAWNSSPSRSHKSTPCALTVFLCAAGAPASMARGAPGFYVCARLARAARAPEPCALHTAAQHFSTTC